MENHMHLARIPQGEERKYIQGLLNFMYNEGKGAKLFMNLVMWVIAITMLSVSFKGFSQAFTEDMVKFIPAIILFGMSVLLIWALIKVTVDLKKLGNMDDFNYIQVWDVRIVEVLRTGGRRISFFGKALFVDGTVSSSKYKLELYSSEAYTEGLLVAIYNSLGNRIGIKLIPRLDYNSKAYRLSIKL